MVRVPERRAYLNITPQVEEFVSESGIAHGLCLVNPMHITAAVYANDDEAGLIQDLDDLAHQVVLAITDGRLDLGAVGAGLLRGVRRSPAQARPVEGDRRITQPAIRIQRPRSSVDSTHPTKGVTKCSAR